MSAHPSTHAAAVAATSISSTSIAPNQVTPAANTQKAAAAQKASTSRTQRRYPVAPPPPPTRQERSQAAFDEIVQALSVDMPLIMHASGDPGEADPESVRLLSELTANYIGDLVHAAMDAHAMMHQGYPPLPPPPFERVKRRFPPDSETNRTVPYPAVNTEDAKTGTNPADATASTTNVKESKRRRITGDFFDEPLPEPKIKKPASSSSSSSTKPQATSEPPPSPEEWVGVQGVDLQESSRARTAYTAQAISTSAFIFPICHDPGLYGRVTEVQRTARQFIAPLLVDPIVQAVVAEEGKGMGRRFKTTKKKKKETAVEGEENEDEEDEDSDAAEEEREQVEGAKWPGLESLLPVHVTADFKTGE